MKTVPGVIEVFDLKYLYSGFSENYFGKSRSIVLIKLPAHITFLALIIVFSLSFI